MTRILINALSVVDGGGWTYVDNLLRELERDNRGFDFTLMVPRGRLSKIGGARLMAVPLPTGPRSFHLGARILYEQIGLPLVSRRFDLLYCLADVAPALPLARTVVALRNLNIYDTRYSDSFRLRVLRRLVALGVPRASRLLFPSSAAAEAIGKHLTIPQEHVRIVPHGIDSEAFATPRPVGAKFPFLFVAAAVERHKNIGVVIEALSLIDDPEIELWIAGSTNKDPTYTDELRELGIRLGVDHRVRFLGPVPYERILDHYRESEAFVFPSFIETFGHPLLEAMVAGTPIVASDIPTFREIAGDAALYFPASDSRLLADAINRARRDRVPLIATGRERVRRFSWRNSIDQLCAVFEEVLRQS